MPLKRGGEAILLPRLRIIFVCSADIDITECHQEIHPVYLGTDLFCEDKVFSRGCG